MKHLLIVLGVHTSCIFNVHVQESIMEVLLETLKMRFVSFYVLMILFLVAKCCNRSDLCCVSRDSRPVCRFLWTRINTNFRYDLEEEKSSNRSRLFHARIITNLVRKFCKPHFTIINKTLTSEQIYTELMNGSVQDVRAVFPVYDDDGSESLDNMDQSNYSFIPLKTFSNVVMVSLRQENFVGWKILQAFTEIWPTLALCCICALIAGAVIWFFVSISFLRHLSDFLFYFASL